MTCAAIPTFAWLPMTVDGERVWFRTVYRIIRRGEADSYSLSIPAGAL